MRKREEQPLEASETRYRRVFETARDGILILDADTGKIVDVNPFLTELTGYSHEDFLGRHLWEIGPFKDIAASKSSFAELRAKEYVRYEDLPLQARDGRKIDVEFVSNVYRVDGRDMIQCNIRDITERRRAEQASEERFRQYIERTPDGVFMVDETGRYTKVNGSACRITGFSQDELERMSLQDLVAEESLEDGLAHFRRLMETGAATADLWHKRKDGSTCCLTVDAVKLSETRVLGFCKDITKRKLAEAERGKLEEQLRTSQKMEAIGGLAGGIAHDFNNLLSVILSYTGFAMEEARDNGPLKDDLREVMKAAERAAVLVRQLLAFSRKQVLQPAPLNLNRIAEGNEKMLRRILGEDIELVEVLAPDLGVVRADPGQIEQVLMNLIVNARDAMPEGGTLTIETSNVEVDDELAANSLATTPGPYVMLAVTDTGCGMDEETKTRLFEPFFTTKGKGTGLGLSTVYGIVRQSGGNVSVKSEPGQGTTFKIHLPRDLTATATVIKPSKAPECFTGTETILVVEDEEGLRKVARRSLEAAGYTVLTAADASEALLIFARNEGDIHLLLADVVMPRMSGRALAQELSKMRPALKVLYMSGYTDDAIVHHGVLEAGTHFLGKPFTAAELTRKVREVLDDDVIDLADGRERAGEADAGKEGQPLDKDTLRALPPDVSGRLLGAVIAARYDEIIELIETIRITDPDVAAGLRRMVDLFDYDGLRNLLEPAEGGAK
ncbi:MAG: PAS domain S-box protein [Deltaproteobacteria bacterium]|nr:PAS domain S-box protein [Deltaproteobacteria bacterium]